MALLILDPHAEAEFRKLRPNLDDDRWTEVWEETTVLSPIANNEHQDIANGLASVFWTLFQQPGHGRAFQGVNLTDRTPNWLDNYRVPDVAVFLAGNPAVDHGTHYRGGPDLAVEVISPNEPPMAKFGFYESIGTCEVLLVHRDPWRLELYVLAAGKLTLAGTSDLANAAVIVSPALGVTYELVTGPRRPQVAVTHPASGREWAV